jgi:formate dehydrogenase alpha subunit
VAGLAKSFGSGAMTNAIPELEDSDCILITGSNTTEAHPLVARRIFKAKEKGAKLIVIDPRRTQIARYADIFVRQRLGTDVAWINGIMHILLKEGWENRSFIEERTEGFDELKKELGNYPPERVEEITGISKANLKEIAETFAKAEKGAIIYAMGITQHITGTENVLSLANLAILTGNIGRLSTGVNPLRGQNNVQGACDMGGLPNVYTGYQSVSDEAVARKFEEAWKVSLSRKPGLTMMEIFQAIDEGKVKGLYIMGENPLVSDPDLHHAEKVLEKLELLVVQDIFPTETAKLAHVILPGVSFAEKDGTFTSTDRRVQRVRKAIEPLGEAKQDWQIIASIAERMGANGFEYSSPEEIFNEMRKLTPIYQGITYEKIEQNGIQWPCRTSEDKGTPFLHQDQFSKGKGSFFPIPYREPAELIDEEFPFWLTTGRMGFQYHTRTMTGVSPSLQKEAEEGFMEMNPFDAVRLGIGEGERVSVISRRGKIEIKVTLTLTVARDVVFLPFHFAESAANVLTNKVFDPVAKIPEYKVCAVKVKKIEERMKS